MHVLWIIFSFGVVIGFAALVLWMLAYTGAFFVAMVAVPLLSIAQAVARAFGYELSLKRLPPAVPEGPLTERQEKRLRKRGMTKVGDTWQFVFPAEEVRRASQRSPRHF